MKKTIALFSGLSLLIGLGVGLLSAPTSGSCKDALAAADSIQSLSAEGFTHAGQALDYAVSWNIEGLDRTTVKMEELGSQVRVENAKYDKAANQCDGGDR